MNAWINQKLWAAMWSKDKVWTIFRNKWDWSSVRWQKSSCFPTLTQVCASCNLQYLLYFKVLLKFDLKPEAVAGRKYSGRNASSCHPSRLMISLLMWVLAAFKLRSWSKICFIMQSTTTILEDQRFHHNFLTIVTEVLLCGTISLPETQKYNVHEIPCV